MLQGAAATIRRFSPKIVIACSAEDFKRRREMVAILRDLQPRYHFAYKGMRLFAWVNAGQEEAANDKRIAIYGTGDAARSFYAQCKDQFQAVCFIASKANEIPGEIPVYSFEEYDALYGADTVRLVLCEEPVSPIESLLQKHSYRKGIDYLPQSWVSSKRIDYFLLRQFMNEQETLDLLRWIMKTTGKELVIYWGNCQSGFMKEFLVRNPEWYRKYILLDIPQVHMFNSQKSRLLVGERFWGLCSVLLYNHVGIENRFAEEFATDFIIKKVPKTCLKVIIPYAFFRGYHPQTIRAGKSNSSFFTIADRYIDDLVLAGKSADEIVKTVLSSDFLDSDYVIDAARESLDELKRREKEFSCDIVISDYIEENYRDNHLFHSPAHPVPAVYVVMAKRLLAHIFGTTTEAIGFEQMDYLMAKFTSSETIMVYPAVKAALGLKNTLAHYYPNPDREKWSFPSDDAGAEAYIRKYLEVCWHIQ